MHRDRNDPPVHPGDRPSDGDWVVVTHDGSRRGADDLLGTKEVAVRSVAMNESFIDGLESPS